MNVPLMLYMQVAAPLPEGAAVTVSVPEREFPVAVRRALIIVVMLALDSEVQGEMVNTQPITNGVQPLELASPALASLPEGKRRGYEEELMYINGGQIDGPAVRVAVPLRFDSAEKPWQVPPELEEEELDEHAQSKRRTTKAPAFFVTMAYSPSISDGSLHDEQSMAEPPSTPPSPSPAPAPR